MINYTVFDKVTGKILRSGSCPGGDLNSQAASGEIVIEGESNDVTQKVVDGEIVDKTTEEIEAAKPVDVPVGKRSAQITNEDWQTILDRLDALESIIAP